MSKQEKWDYKLSLLKEYLSLNDNVYPKINTIFKGVNIGSWVITQRLIVKNGELQKDGSIIYNGNVLLKYQLEELKKMNFKFDSNWSEEKWNYNYNILLKYLEKYKKFPKARDRYDDIPIGSWANTQRITFNHGEETEDGTLKKGHNTLTEERIKKLDKIGFLWILNENNYYKEIIKPEDLKRLKRILLWKLEKSLLEYKKGSFEDKKDIEELNSIFYKNLQKQKRSKKYEELGRKL